MSSDELRQQLGPLFPLMGTWEGTKGDDIAPSDDRGRENNKYRERLTLESIGGVQNHEQSLHVLKYATKAWRIGEEKSFHEELGYWSWEPGTQEIMRCFMIPRGIAVIAGGKAGPDAKEFTLKAEHGSCVFGICSNPFLDREFRTMSYEVTIKLLGPNQFSYASDTVIQLPGKTELFHHRDSNTLSRV